MIRCSAAVSILAEEARVGCVDGGRIDPSREDTTMIKVLDHMPSGTFGVEAVGKVTEKEYRDVLVPAVEAARSRGDSRLLYVLGDDFDSLSPQAAWAGTKSLPSSLKDWSKVAIVSDADWLEHSVKAFGWLLPGNLRVFDDDERDEAVSWLTRP